MSKNYKNYDAKSSKYSSFESSGRSFELKDKFQTSNDSIKPSPALGEKADKSDEAQKATGDVEKPTSQVAEAPKKPAEEVEDVNVLGAKLIKAELFGDQELIASLKARLEVARQKADAQKQVKQGDNSGAKGSGGGGGQHHQKQHHQHKDRKHHGNQKRGHEQGRGDQGNQKRNFRNRQDDSDDGDGGEDIGDAIKKLKNQDNAEKSASSSNQSNAVENCRYCFENAQKHLIVSMGKYCYLCLPAMESLVDGNCLIVPMSHQSSSITCDEEIWNEIQDYKKALVRMFRSKDSDCVFFEQYNTERRLGHMVIECMPLEFEVSNMAPIYFKKAILESESEWAQNKQIIDLRKQGLRKSIPRKMPYFAVMFGIDEGYAHVIENNESFPDHFAKEVIGGILDLDPMKWRRPKRDDLSRQSQKVLEFTKTWKGFDFVTK